MPISTALLLACLAALKWLCFAVGVLMLMLVVRAQFDADVLMPPLRGAMGAGLFFATGLAIALIRKAIARRVPLNHPDKLDG